ncbi:MAG TPA: SGNH/GDSL hydrolase family protein [Gemmataceae bacterium]|nr:SGNH/GDSL hydrolase family protein [Gemmataceae bacterium]
MSISTPVQQVVGKTASGGSTTKNITIAAPGVGASLILRCYRGTGTTISGITGGGVTWAQVAVVEDSSNTIGVEVWAGHGSSGSGTTVAVTLGSAYSQISYNVTEHSGVDSTPILDPSASTNTGTSGTDSTSSVTPTASQEVLLLAVGGVRSAALTDTPTGSFTANTRPGTGHLGAPVEFAFAYRIVASTSGAYGTSWPSSVGYQPWCSIIVGFRAGSGADTTPPTLSGRATNTAGTQITANLSESGCTANGGGSSGTGGFTLGGTSATVSSWAISGTTLTLTLSGVVAYGETVTLTYARASTTDDIKDAAGNFLADFSAASVTNNLPYPLDTTVRILQIGDSLYANTPTGGETVAAHFAKIRAFRGNTANVSVVNSGVSGARVTNWTSGSAYLVAAKSAAVTAFGTPNRSTNPVYAFVRPYANDALDNTNTATYLTDLTSCVNDLVSAGYYVVIQGETYGSGTYGGAVNTRQTTLRGQADTLLNGTTILLGERVLVDLFTADAALRQDDIHPSAAGSEVMAAAEADRLAAILYPAGGGGRLVNGGLVS